jgi:hypothetical protein
MRHTNQFGTNTSQPEDRLRICHDRWIWDGKTGRAERVAPNNRQQGEARISAGDRSGYAMTVAERRILTIRTPVGLLRDRSAMKTNASVGIREVLKTESSDEQRFRKGFELDRGDNDP